MRQDDPWLVSRYSPITIDGTIYFTIAVGLPAGTLRERKSPRLVTYVDPKTGCEYTREADDMLQRCCFATLDQVQDTLDYLKPHHYRAVQIMAGHKDAIPVTMVIKSFPEARGQGLNIRDRELIRKYSAELDPHDPANSIVVAARLVEEHQATRFIRLSRILGGTIWSV